MAGDYVPAPDAKLDGWQENPVTFAAESDYAAASTRCGGDGMRAELNSGIFTRAPAGASLRHVRRTIVVSVCPAGTGERLRRCVGGATR